MVNHSFIEAHFIPHNEEIFLYLKSDCKWLKTKMQLKKVMLDHFLVRKAAMGSSLRCLFNA